MGMNLGGDDDEVMIDINTTPLIDVMLVLLIMLIITIPVQKHSVGLDLPVDSSQEPPPEEDPPEPISLEIDFDGTLYWDGTLIAGGAELDRRLRTVARMTPQPEFHVRPNRLAAYKHVVNVMAAAQRHGVTRMGVIGQ